MKTKIKLAILAPALMLAVPAAGSTSCQQAEQRVRSALSTVDAHFQSGNTSSALRASCKQLHDGILGEWYNKQCGNHDAMRQFQENNRTAASNARELHNQGKGCDLSPVAWTGIRY